MRLVGRQAPTISVTTLRWRARAPRLALIGTCGVLCMAGLRAMLVDKAPVSADSSAVRVDVASIDGFAEAFARTYLSFSPRDPAVREKQLRAFGFDVGALTGDDGGERPRTIAWSAPVASSSGGRGRRIVTVLADDGRRRWYLAVTVARDRTGRLAVVALPAVVGPPAVRANVAAAPELEVDDPALTQVARRAVRHYVAGERTDLVADLAPRAAVTLPSLSLRVADVVAVTWAARPRRVAVAVVAAASGGLRLTLRYELDMVRVAGRWLVRRVQVNPLNGR